LKERYFLEQIIIPIAVFVITTADPPEKIELVQQDIFEHLVGGMSFRRIPFEQI
jgi:hypothetical protein